jgi:uncharacterized RDD family membrane protein YckC
MRSPGFIRYMAIMVYDGLLLLASLFLATAIALPFNGGEGFTSSHYLFHLYIFSVSFAFYGWFWTHGGQTLGMKTWKIKIKTQDGQPVSWLLAFQRFLVAIFSLGLFGAGFLWKLVDKKNLTWHDRLSNTALFFEDDS